MKKHKIKTPEGYEFDRSFTTNIDNDGIRKSIVFRKKPKELPKVWTDKNMLELASRAEIEYLSGSEKRSVFELFENYKKYKES